MSKSIWITWETQRRNRELAKAFGAELKQFDNSNLPSFSRYLKSIGSTLDALKDKPVTVYAQCPSLVLCVLLVIIKPIYGFTLVIDAHNAMIRYLHTYGIVVRLLAKLAVFGADYIIVTNDYLKSFLGKSESQICVLPDKLPEIDKVDLPFKQLSKDLKNVVLISSFAADEPILSFLKAAERLKGEVKFFITGRKSKASSEELSYQSENIIFTDYLTERAFETLISQSDLNVDLTLYEDVLVCGAYESLAVGVPCILSNTKIQRETFKKGFVYSGCDSESLEENISRALDNLVNLKADIQNFREEFVRDWNDKFSKVLSQIETK